MQTNVWRIVWRDSKIGNIIETAGGPYLSHADADAALSTVIGYRRSNLTVTIEREVVEVK